MLEEIGELVLPMARFYIPDIRWHVPDIFAWLCATSTRMSSKSLDQIVWGKFSKGCPRCKKRKGCTCQDVGPAISGPSTSAAEPAELFDLPRPENLDAWQAFFGELYGPANVNSEPLLLLGRLTEDVGRVSRLLRLRETGEPVESLLASIFAWLCGICNRYSASYGSKETTFRLSETVYEKYKDQCAKCHSRPCSCKLPLRRVFICWPLGLRDAGQSLAAHIAERAQVAIRQAEFTERAHPLSELQTLLHDSEHADAFVALIDAGDSRELFAAVLSALRDKGAADLFLTSRKTPKGLDNPLWILEESLPVVGFTSNGDLAQAFDDWVATRYEGAK
jgi:hypothetical protein